ncbi:MAG: hypothetical protein RIQ68_1038 [Pseudomonadota bacterium]
MTHLRLALFLGLLCINAAQAQDWRETKWPFPRDAWPAGQAFLCGDQSCSGHEIIMARVKFGFCNCESGVRDDAEVDYVADVDLISQEFLPLAEGRNIELFGLTGRARAYHYKSGTGRSVALGIALSRKCDVVAISVSGLRSDGDAQNMIDRIGHSPELMRYLAKGLGELLPGAR